MTTGALPAAAGPARGGAWSAVGVLWRRDLVHFARARSRIAAAVGQPVLFWLLLGAGFAGGFRVGDVGYLEYFFPGAVLLAVLFASVFATITVIEDRQQGFLRAVLAAPVARGAVVLGKILGSATLAFLQGAVLLALAPLAGIPLAPGPLVAALAVLFCAAYGLAALGVWLAWTTRTTASFHAGMNLLLFPMWLLSGAAFPVQGAPGWLATAMRLDPLAYVLQAFRAALYGSAAAPDPGPGAPAGAAWAACVGFALLAHGLALHAVRRGEGRG